MKKLVIAGVFLALSFTMNAPKCLADGDPTQGQGDKGASGESWNNDQSWGGGTPVNGQGYNLPSTYQGGVDGGGDTWFENEGQQYSRGGGPDGASLTTGHSNTDRYQRMLKGGRDGHLMTGMGLLAPESTNPKDFHAGYNSGFGNQQLGPYSVYPASSPNFPAPPAVGTGSVNADITNGYD
jgi:hypothetical protein